VLKSVFRHLLTISPEEASFAVRGFEVPDARLCHRLEGILETFIAGYNLAIRTADTEELARRLHESFDDDHVGFAFEGVGLALALHDLLTPGKSTRLAGFLNGAGRDHDYIIAVGAGFAVARLPWGLRNLHRYLKTLDPLLAWCVPDGFGFHQALFHHVRYVDGAEEPPKTLGPFGARLFDSGVGRALWWVKCGHPAAIGSAIDRFPESRRSELWGGVGVAAAYAGGASATALEKLGALSGQYQADFLSGLPFAARLRQKGRNYSEITEMACRVLLGLSTDEVAAMAEAAEAAIGGQAEADAISNTFDMARRYLVNEIRTKVGAGQ